MWSPLFWRDSKSSTTPWNPQHQTQFLSSISISYSFCQESKFGIDTFLTCWVMNNLVTIKPNKMLLFYVCIMLFNSFQNCIYIKFNIFRNTVCASNALVWLSYLPLTATKLITWLNRRVGKRYWVVTSVGWHLGAIRGQLNFPVVKETAFSG